jgi:hypothetical protein
MSKRLGLAEREVMTAKKKQSGPTKLKEMFVEKEAEELIRLPWLGQSGRAAAGCACTAAALRC